MQFSLLGPMEVHDDRGRPIAVSAGKQRVVLAAVLLQANRVVAVDSLIELLWGEAVPSSARAALFNYVARLRRTLGPEAQARLQTVGGGYRLHMDDVAEADHLLAPALEARALDAASAADWQNADTLAGRALALWRGDPLQDVPSDRLHVRYVHELQALRSRLLELRVDSLLGQSLYNLALPLLSELTQQHPLREPLYEREFLAWYASGQRAQALALFQRTRVLLRDELGVQPSATMRELQRLALQDAPTDALIEALKESAPSLVPISRASTAAHDPQPEAQLALRYQLPAAPPLVVGRDAELSALSDILLGAGARRAPSEAAVALLVGTAGVGKTTLALTWSHGAEAAFPDGRLYLDLNGFAAHGQPVTTEGAVRILLDCLGVPVERLPATPEGQLALYRGVTNGKRLLLIFDNARDADQVRPLLPPSGCCRTLVTSRHSLASLVAREGAALVAVAPLAADKARDLLTARMGRERTDGQDDAVSRISEHCAYLPLALVVAAARAASLAETPLDALAAEMDTDRGGLRLLNGGDPASNVRAVLSWSYQQLSALSARLFRLLGMHPGPEFSSTAAASLAGLEGSVAASALAELSAMNLIAEHTPGRYSMHSLLRALAAEILEDCEDPASRDQAYRRLLDHYLHTAIKANSNTSAYIWSFTKQPAPGVEVDVGESADAGAAWFATERPVLAAIIADAAARGLHEYVWQLVYAQSMSLTLVGRWHEDVEFCGLALVAARALADLTAQAHAHRLLGRSLARLGKAEEGLAELRGAEELYRKQGDLVGLAESHRTQGNVYDLMGDRVAAMRQMRKFLDYATAFGERQQVAAAMNAIGWLLAHDGQVDQALDYCEKAADLVADGDEHTQHGHICDSLGLIHFKRGDLARSSARYEQAAALFGKVGNDYQQALALTRLGDVHAAAQDPAEADAAWREALAIFHRLDRTEAAGVLARIDASGFAAE